MQKCSVTLHLCTAIFELNQSEAKRVLRAVLYSSIIFRPHKSTWQVYKQNSLLLKL